MFLATASMGIFTRIRNLLSQVPTQIWVVLLTPLIAITGSEVQKSLESRTYPEINKERIQALEGKWEGYGIQPIIDEESRRRLKDRQIKVNNKLDPELLKSFNDCTFKDSAETSTKIIWFPAHLALQVERTSFLSRKSLQGTLEISPLLEKPSHLSSTYTVTGRLEQNGDYIRLDYVNDDPSKKDFGTLLLEYNSEGKLCGQFLSYGPISRTIVSGKYIFTSKAR
jgi:hypothetical protein